MAAHPLPPRRRQSERPMRRRARAGDCHGNARHVSTRRRRGRGGVRPRPRPPMGGRAAPAPRPGLPGGARRSAAGRGASRKSPAPSSCFSPRRAHARSGSCGRRLPPGRGRAGLPGQGRRATVSTLGGLAAASLASLSPPAPRGQGRAGTPAPPNPAEREQARVAAPSASRAPGALPGPAPARSAAEIPLSRHEGSAWYNQRGLQPKSRSPPAAASPHASPPGSGCSRAPPRAAGSCATHSISRGSGPRQPGGDFPSG